MPSFVRLVTFELVHTYLPLCDNYNVIMLEGLAECGRVQSLSGDLVSFHIAFSTSEKLSETLSSVVVVVFFFLAMGHDQS